MIRVDGLEAELPESGLGSHSFGAFDLLSANIAVINAESRIVFVNAAWIDFAVDNGHPNPAGFVGQNYFGSCTPYDSEGIATEPIEPYSLSSVMEGVHSVLAGRCEEFVFEYPCHESAALERWYRLSVTPADIGGTRGAVTAHIDITDRKVSEQIAWDQANHDSLTGLPNRALVLDRLEQSIRRCRRDRQRGALLFIDLDDFKPINDTHGHAVGDQVLREVARRIRSAVRESDTVARLAGDEFLVIAPSAFDPSRAQNLAAKIEDVIAEPMSFETGMLAATASIGYAMFPSGVADAESVIASADENMYLRKAERQKAKADNRVP